MTIHERALPTDQHDEQQPYSNDSTPSQAKALTKIWLMGTAAWGNRWSSSLGDLPVNADGSLTVAGHLWAHTLSGISPREVMKALAALAGQSDWPPSLAELKTACKDQANEQLRISPPRVDASHRMYRGEISARSSFNESVEENCKAYSARCKEYGYDATDYNY